MGMARLSHNREKPTPVGKKAIRAEQVRRKAARRVAAMQNKAAKPGRYEGISNALTSVVMRRERHSGDVAMKHGENVPLYGVDCYAAMNK